MTIPTISARPSRTLGSSAFYAEVELAWQQLPITIDGINAALTGIDDAVAAVGSGMGAALWAAGTYPVGTLKFGVALGRLWRRTVATASATDPDVDSTGWALMTLPEWPIVYVSGTTHTATRNTRVAMANAAASTLTLPAAPVAGDAIKAKFLNGRTDNQVLLNGARFRGQTDNVLVDVPYFGRTFVYYDSSWGWDIEK